VPPPACVVCAIVRREIPAAIVFEDDEHVAFLDHRPVFHGHVLVAPKPHTETLGDLDPARVGPLFLLVQRMAIAVERGLEADGTFIANNNKVSQSIPHLHVHVVPRKKKDGLKGFFWPRTKYEDEAHMERLRAAIAAAL
jgi:histidine triad (HIT) family protein